MISKNFKSLIKQWKEKLDVSKTTKKNYLCQVEKFFKTYEELSPKSVEDFLIDGRLKRVYVRRFALKKFVEFLSKEGVVDWKDYEEVFKKVKYKLKERRDIATLTYDQLVLLIKKIKDKKLKVILMVAFDTGARIRAILRLKNREVNVYNDKKIELYLREKGERTFLRMITPETYKHLKKFLSSKRKYVFFEKDLIGEEDLEKEYYELWKKLRKESRRILGFEVSFHWVRRSAGVYWYEKTGRDMKAVQDFYGHTNPTVTAKYLKLSGERIKKLMEKERRPW